MTARCREPPHLAPLACAVLACLVVVSRASAGPYETGDASRIERHEWSVYVASAASFGTDGFTGSAPQVEINYGVVEDVQLHAAAPLMLARRTGEATHYGPGDVDLGVKVRLLAQSTAGVAVGTYPKITLPTGSEEQGLGNGRIALELPVWLQKSIGAWTMYAGGGYRAYPGSAASDRAFVGLLAELRSGPVRLGAEVYRNTRFPSVRGRTGFNLGCIVDITDVHHLVATAGVSDAPLRIRTYLAWQLTFGS